MQLRPLLVGATAGVLCVGLAAPASAAPTRTPKVGRAPGRPGPDARQAGETPSSGKVQVRRAGTSRHGAPGPRKDKRPSRPVLHRYGAQVVIPKLGVDGRSREGVSEADLKDGIVHYPGSAKPGRIGNAVYLGHRTTGRAPFADLDRLSRGDRVVLVEGGRRYTYRVVGRKIVLPTERAALAPVPLEPGRKPTSAWATLVTCYPRGFDSHRYVVFARLAD